VVGIFYFEERKRDGKREKREKREKRDWRE